MSKQKPAVSESPLKQNRIVPLDKLVEHPRNYRVHPKAQIDKLVLSLQRFGQGRSIVCQDGPDKLVIVAGHGVFEAATALQWKELRADILPAEWSDAQIEGYLIADNQHSQEASENEELLAMLLTEQKDAGFDLASLGSDDEALRQMLESLGDSYLGSDGEQEDGLGGDEFDTTPKEGPTRTHVGELWQLGEHRLLVGDSTKAENIAKLMQGKKASMAWCDPPFGIDLIPQRGLNESIANDEKVDAQKVWRGFLPLLGQTLLDDTVAFLCQDWTEFDWTLPLVREYFKIKSKIVWYKTQWGIGYYLRPQHEDVLYCWKGTPLKPEDAISDVWEIARSNAPMHAAEKPVALVQRAIEFACEEDGIVVDWFAGVGATVIACERTGRQAYLIELEPRHCDVILKRYEAETNQQAQLLERVEVPAHA